MCVEKNVFLDNCELYPQTAKNIKVRALEKRAVFMHYMLQAESKTKEQQKYIEAEGREDLRKKLMQQLKQRKDLFDDEIMEDYHSFPKIRNLPNEYLNNPRFFAEEQYKATDQEKDQAAEEMIQKTSQLVQKVSIGIKNYSLEESVAIPKIGSGKSTFRRQGTISAEFFQMVQPYVTSKTLKKITSPKVSKNISKNMTKNTFVDEADLTPQHKEIEMFIDGNDG